MKYHPHRQFGSLRPWFWLGAILLCLMPAKLALAVDPIWPPADQLGGVFNFAVPGSPPPTIDATAFDNENQFTINYVVGVHNAEIFEAEDVVNYTNNGLMVANSPLGVNGIVLSFSPGCGFLFDDYQYSTTSLQVPAGTFYNPGTIRANSLQDVGTNAFILGTVGKITVSATNIINSGAVTVGEDGLLSFSGQSVDLTRADLTIEGLNSFFSLLGLLDTGAIFNNGLVALDSGVGTDTNQDWDPSIFLTSTFAESSFFNTLLFPKPNLTQMLVLPSVPYFQTVQNATNYFLTRAVFINPNPGVNVTESVYFGGNPTLFLGPGAVTIQWTGAYTDPATGQPANDYLYLNDFYARGANTNNPVINGVPANFTFTELTTPAVFGNSPAVSALPVFPPGVVTNNYSYVDAQFVASTASTNASTSNPSGALTNLPGRLMISASRDLDLTLASVTGVNYMSLIATNEFKGSPGASIFSPYSDIYLGVTNGYMSVSNLLTPNLPNWSGTVQAWSSDWITVDGNGITNEYRVLLVNPNLSPITVPVVQNLSLHSTNTVISDLFNIIGKLYIDATYLTLTTNLNTGGFGSPDGELNWYGNSILGATQFPNLRWVTNGGAIRSGNLAVFGSSAATEYGAFINNGLLSTLGTTIWATNFFNGGAISNGPGSFVLQSRTTTMTNGTVTAGGDVIITGNSLVFSNSYLVAGRMLQLTATNLLTDFGVTNSIWSVGLAGISGNDSGFNLPIKPPVGDLLGTTVTNTAPPGKSVNNLWAGLDRGYSNSGFLNNAAVGQLVLDIQSVTAKFTFNGTSTNGVTNAIYVDCLHLDHYASYTNRITSTNIIPTLSFNTNLVIYYAQALTDDGISIADKINHYNGDHLRWVPSYAGTFSSVYLIYPDGTTNMVNAALRFSQYDSDGDGILNNVDPSPIFTTAEVNFAGTVTNLPPKSVKLEWMTAANATNYVYYTTNLLSTNWLPLTTFKNIYFDPNMSVTNAAHTNWFASPTPPPWPVTNVWIFDTITNVPHYYRVSVQPWLTDPN